MSRTPIKNRAMITVHATKSVRILKVVSGRNSHGFFQPLYAVGASLNTNTMRTRPAVTKAAPIQSTRLSFSVDGSSSSKTKYPNIINAKAIPENKNIGVRQVSL